MEQLHPRLPAIVTAPERAQAIRVFNLNVRVLLGTEETGGALSALLISHEPGDGAPDHHHLDRDEVFFIVEGVYEVTIAGEASRVARGGMVFVPRQTVHRFRNIGATTACMLDLTVPGDQDHFFEALSELASQGVAFESERTLEVSRAFDTHFKVPD